MSGISRGPSRFNPPAGWPAAPQGWVPPAGWAPDPSWPAAPKGHRFWLDATSGRPTLGPPGAYGAKSKGKRFAGCGCLSLITLFVAGSCLGAISTTAGTAPTDPSSSTSPLALAATPTQSSARATPSMTPQTDTATTRPTSTLAPKPTTTRPPTPVADRTTTPAPKPAKTRPPTPAPARTTTPAPVRLATPTRSPQAPATQAPVAPVVPAGPPPGAVTVHGGSFCSGAGSIGISEKGRTLVCRVAKDGRLRWQRP